TSRLIWLFIGVDDLAVDSAYSADSAAERVDFVGRGIHSYADDMDVFLTIGDSLPADDVIGVLVKKPVQAFYRFRIFNDDGQQCNSFFHRRFPFCLYYLEVPLKV